MLRKGVIEMTLRERCQRLAQHLVLDHLDNDWVVQDIEQFAREIRNEALEEAAHAIVCTPKHPLSDHDAHKRALDRVLALKDVWTFGEDGGEYVKQAMNQGDKNENRN